MSKNKKNDEMDRNGQLLAENRENSTEEVKSDSYKLGYTWFIFFPYLCMNAYFIYFFVTRLDYKVAELQKLTSPSSDNSSIEESLEVRDAALIPQTPLGASLFREHWQEFLVSESVVSSERTIADSRVWAHSLSTWRKNTPTAAEIEIVNKRHVFPLKSTK